MEQATPLANSVEEVLEALDAIVSRCRDRASPLGYFAAMYRKVTAKVHEGIAEGFFDDGERMGRLDVVFANRYLEALDTFERHGRPTRAWELACQAAGRWRPIVLQHLLVAVNAHINLDLGIAAAQTAPGDDLPGLRRDFDRINEILAALVRQVQRELGEISPWIAVLDLAGGRGDDTVVRFSIEVAREKAWRFATELAPLPAEQYPAPVRTRDTRVSQVARMVLRPGPVLGPATLVIRARESDDVARNIDVLSGVADPDLADVEACVHEPRALDD